VIDGAEAADLLGDVKDGLERFGIGAQAAGAAGAAEAGRA